jgi:hypothetical protein
MRVDSQNVTSEQAYLLTALTKAEALGYCALYNRLETNP